MINTTPECICICDQTFFRTFVNNPKMQQIKLLPFEDNILRVLINRSYLTQLKKMTEKVHFNPFKSSPINIGDCDIRFSIDISDNGILYLIGDNGFKYEVKDIEQFYIGADYSWFSVITFIPEIDEIVEIYCDIKLNKDYQPFD